MYFTIEFWFRIKGRNMNLQFPLELVRRRREVKGLMQQINFHRVSALDLTTDMYAIPTVLLIAII